MTKREEIIECMQETIEERMEAIQARPSSKREFELSLVSSGMNIIESEEAQAWAQQWRL